ncbi:mechanosensitive ion channel family protein [Capnocytophaga sp. oral taxon 878]|uniref:mechanosensitive ion channel family protein n=1 Tax=Capnocytophaga sp. oral taxon 878 TaxID=1316596 RepID=UPI000D03E3FF|nr:mechanosensitive ion channel domain-containing protein [Capnocytophaga sp. oral taxon 878]AVM50904.1 mechanosensitive ion channel protein [Capnocytophaga sp. oral taxon 878]
MNEISKPNIEKLFNDWVTGLLNFIPTLVGAIALYFAGKYIIRFIIRFLKRIMERREVDLAMRNFLLQVVRWVLYIALFLMIVQIIGLPATQFIAILTSAFVAVGLALQGSLSNFASGIMILVFKPFKVGDTIEGNGQKGTVKNIGLFATVLNKPDNEEAIIPNTQLFSNSIINYSREEKRRVHLLVGIGYNSSIEKARDILLEVARNEPKALAEPAPVVYVEELADSSVNISLRYWCLNSDRGECYFRSLEAIKKGFDAAGIEIPFPQVQVHRD